MMKVNEEGMTDRILVFKKFGLLGFIFFFGKGVLWLLVPTMLAYFNMN